jgi:hypothetical protein
MSNDKIQISNKWQNSNIKKISKLKQVEFDN